MSFLARRYTNVAAMGGAAWTPASLGGNLLEAWDAENAASVPQSAGAVTTWTSTVSGLAPTQGTSSKRGVWSATNFGARPGILLDGIDDFFSVTGVGNLPTGANPSWVWSVASQDALPADVTARHTLTYGQVGSAFRRDARRSVFGAVNTASGVIGNGTSGTIMNAVGDYSGRHLTVVKASGTKLFIDFDSTLDVTGTAVVPATPTSTVSTVLGAVSSAANFWQGTINSIWVTAPLGASDEALMRAYCLARL